MSNNRNDHRNSNGSRLEGFALVAKIAQQVIGMGLAQAYATTKSAGFHLRINKIDGVTREGYARDDRDKVMVNVVRGTVTKGWASCVQDARA